MVRENKKKKTIVLSLIGLTLLMTVGYAAFQTNLEIKGTSKITSTWDVKITNVSVTSENGDGENVTFSHTDTTASMEADLYEKGDSVEYDVLIENAGTIAASIKEITNSTKSTNEAVKITFSGFTEGDILQPNTSQTIHVKIEVDPDYSGTPPTGSTEIEITPEYVQPDSGQEEPDEKYLVTYDCTTNGGKDCSSFNENLKPGTTVNLTNIADSVGELTFIGWNTDKNAKTALSSLTMSDAGITLYAIFKDMQSPVIHFNPESQDDYTRKTQVTVNLSDNGTGLAASQSIYYAWSKSDTTVPTTWTTLTKTNTAGQKESSITVPASASSNLTGKYYLWIKSGITDVYGNSADAKVSESFLFDNTNPTLSISTSSSTNSITVIAKADAASGIKKYEFSMGNDDWIDNGTNNTYTFDGIASDVDDGAMSIADLVKSATNNGDGLYADDYEKGKYTYKGASPNNYIQLDGVTLWRIISVDTDGTLKIIRTTSDEMSVPDYLNLNPSDFIPEDLLYLTVPNATWNTGGIEENEETILFSIDALLHLEKSSSENRTLGLISLTEFLRASDEAGNSCSDIDEFRGRSEYCSITHNWLGSMFQNYGAEVMTLTPLLDEEIDEYNWSISSNADLSVADKSISYSIFPVVNLRASTYIIGGDGSESNPYILQGQMPHTVQARVTSGVGLTQTVSEEETLGVLNSATFSETEDIDPRTVYITYPEGCGDTLTCSYIKDNDSVVDVINEEVVAVPFTKNGTLIATVSNGVNEVSSSYTAILDGNAPTVSFSPGSQSTYTKSTPVTVTISDSESGLKADQSVYYAWSESSSTVPTTWTELTTTNTAGQSKTSVTVPASASSNLTGKYYLWIKSGISDVFENTSGYKTSGAFYFDNIAPTCTTAGGSDKWVASTKTIVGNCSDSDSGCSSSSISKTYSIATTESGSYNADYSPGTVTDNAGNSATCPTAKVKVTGITLDDYQSGAIFKFDGKTGLSGTTWKDQSGNSRNGTIVGATISGNSLYFDGSNDYVRIAQLNYQNVTLESSFRFKSLPSSEAHIISNIEYGGYAIYKSSADNKMGAIAYKDGAYRQAYTSAPSIGTTYYGATRVNNAYTKSTLNETTTTTNYSAAITNTTNNTYMVLGGDPNGSTVSTGFFNGYIYTARMYSSVLTDDQLQKHYVIDKARFGY